MVEFLSSSLVYYYVGIVIMFILGIAAGNYATSFIYRLPRGLTIANDPPYCECERRVYLSPKDLFPVFSWLSTRGKCRYCAVVAIPVTYTIVEALCGILFSANYFIYGFGQALVLILSMDVILITIAALYFIEKRLFAVLVSAFLGVAAVYRMSFGEPITGFFMGGYLAMMVGIVIWGAECAIARKRTPFPIYAMMLGLGGWCLGKSAIIPFVILSVFFAIISYAVLGRISPKFRHSAWVMGTVGSMIVMLSYLG
ncbi:MAG: prepilin peptidase [Alphaproteobacteria bacterium]|jgi:prepilin signal peptidase PulO-like enzyme (type II secretory pathway)|nr:MAG: prepilin peptidase [Alphaproteobacteria bacterium]